MTPTEYVFDVKLFATVRVKANTKAKAVALLKDTLDCASFNAGVWPNGDPVLFEASVDGEPDLVEIDGEPA